METKLLVKEKKGHSFRLYNINENKFYRAMSKEFSLTIGSLLTVDTFEVSGDLITEMSIANEIVGDSTKSRVEVCIDEVKLGDLIDGVPVLSFGNSFAKKGKKVAFAYFK